MWLYLVAGVPFGTTLLYFAMKNGFLTFGIDSLKQRRDHGSKEWKTERSIIPLSTSGTTFEIETEVKWCPETDEIYYRNPKDSGIFDKEWVEVSEYTGLYKRLRRNFYKKYKQPKKQKKGRKWTAFNQ